MGNAAQIESDQELINQHLHLGQTLQDASFDALMAFGAGLAVANTTSSESAMGNVPKGAGMSGEGSQNATWKGHHPRR